MLGIHAAAGGVNGWGKLTPTLQSNQLCNIAELYARHGL